MALTSVFTNFYWKIKKINNHYQPNTSWPWIPKLKYFGESFNKIICTRKFKFFFDTTLTVQYNLYCFVDRNFFQLPNVHYFKTINEYLGKNNCHFIKRIRSNNEKKANKPKTICIPNGQRPMLINILILNTQCK